MTSAKAIISYFTIILWLIPQYGNSQSSKTSISDLPAEFYDQVFGVDQRIVSGPYYNNFRNIRIDGHPFYINNEWNKGTVKINDLIFEDLLLKYDVEKNEIILRFININYSSLLITLRKSLINRFTLGERVFIPYPGSNIYDTTKFCEVLATGPVSYLMLKAKQPKVSSNTGSKDYYYQETVKQFIQIDDRIEPFRTRRKLFKLYPQHKNEIKRFIRRERLQPYKKRTEDRAAMIMYCNKLIEEQN